MASTYKDIQKETGLSLSTISKYFNGGELRPANKKAIESAVKKLDFRINDFARGLKSKQSRTIGLLIPELDSVFHTTIMRHISNIMREKGYGCLVCDCNADKNAEEQALDFLLGKMVDGIITIPVNKTGAHLLAAKSSNVPVVLIDRLCTNFKTNAVIIDNFEAGKNAAKLFIDNNHERIAMISGPASVFTMQERQKGFYACLKEKSLHKKEYFINADFTIEGGYNAAKEILNKANHPTALFCANYELTLGTIIAMNEMGLRYPDDISLIGFDNMLLSRVLKPRLTAIEQPLEKIADEAANLMLKSLSNAEKDNGMTIVLPTDMIEGSSVCAI